MNPVALPARLKWPVCCRQFAWPLVILSGTRDLRTPPAIAACRKCSCLIRGTIGSRTGFFLKNPHMEAPFAHGLDR